MFCGNCGANNPEGSSVCGSCGAALTPEQPTTEGKKPVDTKKIIGLAVAIGGAILVLALVIWLVVALLSGGGAKGAAKDYINASIKGDAKTLVELAGPDDLLEVFLDNQEEISDKNELIDDLEGRLKDAQSEYADYFGKGYKAKVEVKKVKNWKESELKDYMNDVLDTYDLDYEVQEGATVTLRITVQGKDEKEVYKPELEMVKVNGKWYVTGSKTGLYHDLIWDEAYDQAFGHNHKKESPDERAKKDVMLELSPKLPEDESENYEDYGYGSPYAAPGQDW